MREVGSPARRTGSVRSRRRGAAWTIAAAVEVVLAIVAVATDRVVPTLVLLVLAAVSLAARREGPWTLGFRRLANPGRVAAEILGLTVAWSLVQLAVIMPVLNHLTGDRQDLSQFDGLQGDLAMLLGLLALSWTLAAVGEELVYRGYVPTRVRDVVGPGRAGIVAAVLVSSMLFGLAHTEQGTIGVVVTFLDALFFSAIRLRYDDNLWAPVLAHGFNNTLGLVAFFLVGPIYGFW
jgi:membrane protease YdiL (CAAX protease family)